MRVHRLEVTAFGPFAGTELIDFDELNAAGFFLLTGPTGAGKTSVLDAICFGLYGAVPGVRNNARDLKSHHADPRVPPVVEVEVTLRDRRFRIRRTPGWRRPSSRAKSGYVDENASVTAAELVDGSWVPRGNRLDEVGLLVTRTLGMTKEQFCQVVMLPQGQFETFLRSGAKERHDVLEALFQTGRFLRIEQWLSEHKRRAEQASDEKRALVEGLLVRAEEVNTGPWEEPAATLGAKVAGLHALVSSQREALSGLHDRWTTTETAAKEAEHARSEGERVRDHQREHAEAARRLQDLDGTAQAMADLRSRIARAHEAQLLVPHVTLVRDAERHLAAAATEQEHRRVEAEHWPGPDSDDTLIDQIAATQMRLATLQAHAALDVQIDEASAALATARDALAAASAAGHVLSVAAAELPALLATARAELAGLVELAGRADVLEQRVGTAMTVLTAARLVPAARAALATALQHERSAHDRQLDAREVEMRVREARIASMAAHLAASLRADDPCPVCGSVEHPVPAVERAEHAGEADEQQAALARAKADEARQLARDDVRHCEQELADLVRESGDVDAPTAEASLLQLQAALAEAKVAVESAAALDAHVVALADRQATLQTEVTDQQSVLSGLEVDVQHKTARVDDLVRRRADLVTDGSIATATGDVEQLLAHLRRWHEAELFAADAESALSERREDLALALADTEFDHADAVSDATMSAPDVANANGLLRSHDRDRALARHTLDDEVLAAAAALPAPDLDALGSAAERSALEHQQARDHYRQALGRHDRLAELLDDLSAAEADWAPLRSAADVAAQVAALCAGTSADNQTRTKLSHYVLAARLQQVVAAANLRLASISSGRYQLAHTMVKGVGDTRGGLGLRVVDGHTGAERDPATLSGGETFYVSLALALGLADLVRDEIGGAELSTLFVDEGFGSLDPDTLDEVLDEIDSLRSGGRCVGLVSHLDELRRRIPTQVRIVPSSRGSRVAVD